MDRTCSAIDYEKHAYSVLSGNPDRNHFEDQDVGTRIILKWILYKIMR